VDSGGYYESTFRLWRHNGTNWSDTGATLDTGANTLTLSSHVPGSTYGILSNATPVNMSPVDLFGANVSNVTHHPRYNGTGAVANASTQGGNLTGLNMSTTQLSERWAAFYGDVQGNIVLTDAAASNYVYSWVWSAADGGTVCVSTNSSLGSIYAGGATGSDIDNAWSYSSDATDSGTNTFSSTNCTLDIGSASITDASYADTGTAGGFMTCALKSAVTPAKANMVFCSDIIPGGTTWNNGTGDYEVMVPTPIGPGTTETYYFYANLN
jgi:hypothetical protein